MNNTSLASRHGTIDLIPISFLLPTEEFNEARVLSLIRLIGDCDTWNYRIALEEQSYVIMDGHHRFEAAKRLGLRRVPCALFSYDAVTLETRRPEISFSKGELIRWGQAGLLLPEKTTRHIFPADSELECQIPLSELY